MIILNREHLLCAIVVYFICALDMSGKTPGKGKVQGPRVGDLGGADVREGRKANFSS
jgi:hypothetical protein